MKKITAFGIRILALFFFIGLFLSLWFFNTLLHKKNTTINQPHKIQTTAVNETVHVPILVYHSVRSYYTGQTPIQKEFDVEPNILEEQFQYLLKENYHIISFEIFIDHFLRGTPLPSQSIIITFDDGWVTQYTNAFPILQKLKITATFFVFTNAIGHSRFFNIQQLHELDAAGMTIASHTRTHLYLPKIKDLTHLRSEIIGGKKDLEKMLGKPVRFFAYPFGHYNDLILQIVKEAGFDAARSTSIGTTHTKEDLFTLRSIEVTNSMKAFIYALKKE